MDIVAASPTAGRCFVPGGVAARDFALDVDAVAPVTQASLALQHLEA
jgi:hypothetical protein